LGTVISRIKRVFRGKRKIVVLYREQADPEPPIHSVLPKSREKENSKG